MEDLGVIHKTRVSYPYLDPFKKMVPRPFISYMGPPDTVNDFYRGPDDNYCCFFRKVYAEYHAYLVTGTDVKF